MRTEPSDMGNREKEIFLDAQEIKNPVERKSFLRQICGADTALRDRVEKLLAAAENNYNWLDPDKYQTLEIERNALLAQMLPNPEKIADTLDVSIQSLRDYELVEEIGRGSSGIVFRAIQQSLQRVVALKVLIGHGIESPSRRDRFRAEAVTAASVNHPNVISIFEIDQHEGYDYFTMPLVSNGTLADHFKEIGAHPKTAARLIEKVAEGVQSVHERGVLHRDLKPSNILIDEDGEPRVSDFGVSCLIGRSNDPSFGSDIAGTPQYMAPEQVERGELPITAAADVYSIGAILYELLAGKPLFEADSVYEALKLVKAASPAPLRALRPEIDQDLESIVMKCLEKTPEQRYPSAKALAEDLEAWRDRRSVTARPPKRMRRTLKWIRRKPIHAALLSTSGILILLLGIGGPIISRRNVLLNEELESERQRRQSSSKVALEQRALAIETAKDAELRAGENQRLSYAIAMQSIKLDTDYSQAVPHIYRTQLDKWLPLLAKSDLRGWEWYYQKIALSQYPITLDTRKGALATIQFDPSGEFFIHGIGKLDRIVKIRSSTSGMHQIFYQPEGKVRHADWNSDGKLIVTVLADGSCRIWDSGKLQYIATLPNSPLPNWVSWNQTRNYIATACADNRIRIWSIENLDHIEEFARIEIPASGLNKALWSSDGSYLAATADSNIVFYWSTNSLDSHPKELIGHVNCVTDIAWSPTESLLASSSFESGIVIWELPSGNLKKKLRSNHAENEKFAWNPTRFELVSGGGGKKLNIWDINTGKIAKSLESASPNVTALDWSPDGQTIVSGYEDGMLRIQRADFQKPNQVLLRSSEGVESIQWSNDGSLLSCYVQNGTILIVDSRTGEIRMRHQLTKANYRHHAWNPVNGDLNIFSQSGQEHSLDRIDPTIGHVRRERIELPKETLLDYSMTLDRRTLITSVGERHTALWGGANCEKLQEFKHGMGTGHGLPPFAQSPNGQYMLSGNENGDLNMWELENNRIHLIINKNGIDRPIVISAWHPNSSKFAVIDAEGYLSIWNCRESNRRAVKMRNLVNPNGKFISLAWHPDGSRLATGDDAHAVAIWDWRLGISILELEGHTDVVTELAWSPDGLRLASASRDGTLRIWDATEGYRIAPE